jgi:hypothetical protein
VDLEGREERKGAAVLQGFGHWMRDRGATFSCAVAWHIVGHEQALCFRISSP